MPIEADRPCLSPESGERHGLSEAMVPYLQVKGLDGEPQVQLGRGRRGGGCGRVRRRRVDERG